ncbi:MAG: GAF domain-containing protein [Anaerolineae bacterium]|nr:GAF domain-containing protein [Anaerolineae bacterium]
MLLGIRWGSLRAKIIAWSFFPTAIILVAVAWVTFLAYQTVTEDLVIERNRELTRYATSEFAAGLTEYTGLLTEYAGLLAGLPRSAYAFDSDLVLQRDVLDRARSRFGVFDGGVVVLSNRGKVVAAGPNRMDIQGQDWSDRPYFRQMLRTPAPVFSDVLPDGPFGSEVIVVAIPIRGDQGQFLGTIAGLFRLDLMAIGPFYRSVTQLRIGTSGNTYLVDGSGKVIYHSDPGRIGDDFSTQVAVQRVSGGQAGVLRTKDLNDREIVASFAPVPGTPWGLVSEEMWATLTSGGRGYQRFLLLLLALGVVVPALVVAVGVRRITRPVTELIDAAQKVAGGDFGQTITARTGDEIEELAVQFNRMAAQLQESYAHLEKSVADRTEELAALNAIAAVVSQSMDLDDILSDALDKTLQVMEIESGGIYLLDETTKELSIAAYRGFSEEFIASVDKLALGEGFSGRVAQSGEPLVVKDVTIDPRLTREVVREAGFRSLAVVPLRSKGTVLGTLFAQTHGYREFSDQDLQLLTSIGHQVGIAVDNARLLGQAERRTQELEALYRADDRMRRYLHLDQVLQALVDVAVDILEADKSSVMVWDEDREALVMRVARGFDPELVSRLSFDRDEEITGMVATTGEPTIVQDSLTDLHRAGERPATLRIIDAEGIRSFMHLPIKIDSEVFGVFNVSFLEPHAFSKDEGRLFLALAQRAALAIEKARLYDQAQELAVLEERARLARDLHDAVTQTLFSASLIAEILPDLWESDQKEARQLLGELRQLSRGALAEMRTLLLELRPAALIESNLGDLLRQLGEAVTGREGIPVTVMMGGAQGAIPQAPVLPPDVHVAIYRIAQEALNNVVKHAQADHVVMSLHCSPPCPVRIPSGDEGPSTMLAEQVGAMRDRGVELCIRDDGLGFDPDLVSPDHLGLGIIRERAQAIGAKLSIESAPGAGTQIVVVWNGEQ